MGQGYSHTTHGSSAVNGHLVLLRPSSAKGPLCPNAEDGKIEASRGNIVFILVRIRVQQNYSFITKAVGVINLPTLVETVALP